MGRRAGRKGRGQREGREVGGCWWCAFAACVFLCPQRRSRLCDAEVLLGLLELLLIEKATGSPLDFDVVGDSGSLFMKTIQNRKAVQITWVFVGTVRDRVGTVRVFVGTVRDR